MVSGFAKGRLRGLSEHGHTQPKGTFHPGVTSSQTATAIPFKAVASVHRLCTQNTNSYLPRRKQLFLDRTMGQLVYDVQDLLSMKANGVVEELHVVDWFPKHQLPITNGYRRLDAYLKSTLLHLSQEGVCKSGIVQASLLSHGVCTFVLHNRLFGNSSSM